MARVPYLEPEEAPEVTRRLMDRQLALTNRLPNYHKVLAQMPWMYPWYIGLASVVNSGPVDRRFKRLAHVQTSLVNGCEYCTSHNMAIAEDVGIPSEQLSALEQGRLDDPQVFDSAERAVVHWATAVASNTARRDASAFAEMERHFSPAGIIELTFVCAWRTMSNRMMEALWLDLEEERLPPPRQVPVSELVEYATSDLVSGLMFAFQGDGPRLPVDGDDRV